MCYPPSIPNVTFELTYYSWVLSTLLPKPWQDLHSPGTLYHPSQTSKLNDSQSWSVTYESGVAARGLVAVDDVSIGLSNEIAQSVELATNVSLNLLHNGADGFLGLGFDNVNGGKHSTRLQHYVAQYCPLKTYMYLTSYR